MEKTFIIIMREYMQRLRTTGFLIGTIATPMLLVGVSLIPAMLSEKGEQRVFVFDESGDPALFGAIKKSIESSSVTAQTSQVVGNKQNFLTRYTLSQEVAAPGQDIDELRLAHYAKNRQEKYAYIVLRRGSLEGVEPEYYAENISDFSLQILSRSISSAIIERRVVHAGFEPGKIEQYLKPVEMKKIKMGPDGETRDSEQSTMVALVMLLAIYFTLGTYGTSVMRGVVEEKRTRIVEVIVSSVRPFEMMMGKIIGIGLVGLTQCLIWALSAVILTTLGVAYFAGRGLRLSAMSYSLWVYFVIYFMLGYFLFATLYAMVGSLVSNEQDQQQFQFPVTMLNALSVMLFWVVMKDPNGQQAVVLSMIPFFSPTLMILRLSISTPPAWQILLSIALMIASILTLIWVAAKIYRVGIFMHGKRPSLIEIGRWLRYS